MESVESHPHRWRMGWTLRNVAPVSFGFSFIIEVKCWFCNILIGYCLLPPKNRRVDFVKSKEVKIANLLTKIGDFWQY